MKTTLKKLLCIVIALASMPVFGCSNKDSPSEVSDTSITSEADRIEEDVGAGEKEESEETTTTTKKITTTRATTTTVTTTTTSDVTVTDESGSVLTGTDGEPVYVTTITDAEGEIIAVTTVTDEDGEAVTDDRGDIVTGTVSLTVTSITTTPIVVTTTTTRAQTVAITTTTTAAPVVATTVATTKATTTAKTTTTTPKSTAANGVCSTVVMAEGEPITVYYRNEAPSNPTLQAYSDLAEYGVLTDEIRQLITEDVMNYASTKYGFVLYEEFYANSTTDYYGSFHGGAKNNSYNMSYSTVALSIKWGAISADYIMPSLDEEARAFQARMYGWVDTTAENLIAKGYDLSDGWASNVGFCYFSTTESGYNVYQVSFLY